MTWEEHRSGIESGSSRGANAPGRLSMCIAKCWKNDGFGRQCVGLENSDVCPGL
jgi:hypothetical protein